MRYRGEVCGGGRLNEGLEGLAEAMLTAECPPAVVSRTSMSPQAVHIAKTRRWGASLTKMHI
jgi:hypothetical protein